MDIYVYVCTDLRGLFKQGFSCVLILHRYVKEKYYLIFTGISWTIPRRFFLSHTRMTGHCCDTLALPEACTLKQNLGCSEETSVLGRQRFTSHHYSNLCWRIKLLLSKLCLRFDINRYEISLHSPVISLENGVIIPKRSLWANKGSC